MLAVPQQPTTTGSDVQTTFYLFPATDAIFDLLHSVPCSPLAPAQGSTGSSDHSRRGSNGASRCCHGKLPGQ
jgi:hypothetical protein